ncbi:MAG: hypothetical protein ACTTIC_04755 [Helicobacteraceae bacterium]
MNEILTGAFTLTGTFFVLMALYTVKTDRQKALYFLIAGAASFGVAVLAAVLDGRADAIKKDFLAQKTVFCGGEPISQASGWEIKGGDFFIRSKEIYFIKKCQTRSQSNGNSN